MYFTEIPDLARPVAACHERLGPPENWRPLYAGYSDSLALCVIDSIQSIGVRYGAVENVVKRYRDRFPKASTHGAPDLVQSFVDVPAWKTTIGNKQRTYARPWAPRKADVIRKAAELLCAQGVTTTALVRGLNAEQLDALEQLWQELPGQKSGISWRYVLMLAGLPGVKPDRWVRRFIAQALDVSESDVSPGRAEALLVAAASELGVSPNDLDHVAWLCQSGRAWRRWVSAGLCNPSVGLILGQ